MTSVLTVTEDPPARLTRGMVLLLAVACGIGAANLYYAQPVLSTVARQFGTSSGTAGLIVTFTQIGYAAGLFLLVPLGDLLTRRRLIPAVLAVTTAGLIASASAPGIGLLIAAALVTGAGSVAVQMLIPMAASLAEDANRGRVVGTVMTGLLLGILLARTVSGAVAGLAGWRTVYLMAAALTAALAAVLWRALPAEQERARIGYGALLRSTVRFFLTERLLQRRALFGALAFAGFSVLWTTIAFLLAGAPYHYGDVTIGLFGLVGAAGAVCANLTGRWADRGGARIATLVFAITLTVSFLLLWYGRDNLALLITGILVLDVGTQGVQVTNQSLIYRLAPAARSRINSSYMVCYFAGGALGSAAASLVYDAARWPGVCLLGAAIGAALTLLAATNATRRPARATPSHPKP